VRFTDFLFPVHRLQFLTEALSSISEYAFSQSYGFLDNLQASKAFFDGAAMTWPLVYIVREVPMLSQLLRIMDSLPDWLMPQNAGMVAQKEWSRVSTPHLKYPAY
jgi:hypothetical protein